MGTSGCTGMAWSGIRLRIPSFLTPRREAALMIESGSHRELDFLIVVTAPEALRVERVMQRDGVEAEAVYARIRNQMPESEKVELADFIIENDGNRLLTPQVWAIHRDLFLKKLLHNYMQKIV
ncbi:MAG: dephospho-CoA kinase [Saprospiraceae bacterium]